MIRVLIVDDYEVVRAGLEELLAIAADMEVVGSTASAAQAVGRVAAADVDVVLIDVAEPQLDGTATTRELRRSAPNTKIVVLTASGDHDQIATALDAGATGVLHKYDDPGHLLDGIRAAARGEPPG